MKKYQTFFCLACIFCILLNASGCNLFTNKNQISVFSDSNREVSFVGGTNESSIGIVLDKREFLLCDCKGSESGRIRFEQDIEILDILGDCILLAFSDNHIEEFRFVDGNKELLGSCRFDQSIVNAEFTAREYSESPMATVLLSSGELLKNEEEALSSFSLVDEGVTSFAYDIYSDVMLYTGSKGILHCFSFGGYDYRLDDNLQNLQNAYDVKSAAPHSKYSQDIRFSIHGDFGSAYVKEDLDTLVFSICDDNTDETTLIGVSKSVGKGIVYQRDGNMYYEGSSINRKKVYGEGVGDPLRISIPNGYTIHPIQGGVVYYNDHEVKVLLIK